MIKIDYDRQREGQSVYENYIGALQASDQSKIVWYSASGNDSTGNGTVATPYQTRAKANSETSAAKPYALLVDDFYIPGYSSTNIVYLDTVSGNDSNDGSTELLAKLTYASAATAAGSTKKIRVINDGAVLTNDITKPTEAKAGIVATIKSASLTAPVDVWTQAGTPSFSGDSIGSVAWSPKLKIFLSAGGGGGGAGKTATSTDGETWIQNDALGIAQFSSVVWSDYYNKFFVLSTSGRLYSSVDGENFSLIYTFPSGSSFDKICITKNGLTIITNSWSIYYSSDMVNFILSDYSYGDSVISAVSYSETLGIFCVSPLATSSSQNISAISNNGINWEYGELNNFVDSALSMIWVSTIDRFIVSGSSGISQSPDGLVWSSICGSGNQTRLVAYINEIDKVITFGGDTFETGVIKYASLDDISLTTASTPSFGGSEIFGFAYSEYLNKIVAVGESGKIAYSTAYTTTVSSNISGFNLQAVLYSGTISLQNCTMIQPGSSNALTTTRCHITEGYHFSNNTQSHTRLLCQGPAYFTTTPAAQNAFSLDACTFTDGAFIYNASQTGYERIRDLIIEGGLYANYLVAVLTGNVTGVSTNALLTASVGTSEPLLGDDGRPNRPWLPSGSGTESPVIAVALYSTNSDGIKNDLGAFIVNDEGVGYTFTRSKYLPSGQLKIGKGIESSEQIADNGEVDVFGNPDRAVEVVLISYESLSPDDTALIDELDELDDYTVRLNLYPDTQLTAGTVTINGNQSAGVYHLVIDEAAIHPGLSLTIDDVEYYVLYAYPNNAAATAIVLNKPLESNVSDNDVITTNYPAGYGEYSYSPKSRELSLSVAQSVSAYLLGPVLRFIRKWQ